MDEFKVGDIVLFNFPGSEGCRVRTVEEVSKGTFAVAYESGLADVYASGWLERVDATV